ncbi:MAG: hypothetical protein HYS74_02300 [Parcubacteria group bacterium]|nr:hypothetical protein [Parcubacteria group bacterium]
MGKVKRFFFKVAAVFLAFPSLFAHAQSTRRLENPLRDIGTVPQLVRAVLDVVVQIGAPIAAIFIIYSGFLFILARGNPTKLEKAKSALTWTVVGTAVLLGAWVLSQAIGGTIEQLRR